MKGYKPGTLGYELKHDSSVTYAQAKRNLRNIEKKRDRLALKSLDHAFRHGEDIFESVTTDVEAEKELSDSGIIALADLHPETPEEQIEHEYLGLTPQDPEYWQSIRRKR